PQPGVSHTALGQNLCDMLIGPAREYLKPGVELIIIPDGILHYLPFGALVTQKAIDQKQEARYLIEDYTISYAPSASVLDILIERPARSVQIRRRELLAFGDPLFGETTEEADLTLETTERGLYQEQGCQFSRLPYTKLEVTRIASLFPEESTSIYLGAAAAEERVKGEDLTRYRRVHFATHGLIDEAIPGRSCVVLALDDDPAEDGFLQMREIFNLKFDADLVVLSACQTGRGKLVRGEGLIGLSRAFLYAGANSMLLSLWSVNDRSTAELMESFYRSLQKGKEKSEALRTAKLDLLEGEIQALRHPYYWAPFILLGR
ncbi:MAG: CHAT domain-containing protein, partial [bacterium]